MAAVFFYISGHGFGHASRQIEIVNALGAVTPLPQIFIRTSAPRWLFDRTLRVPAVLLPAVVDTGVVQIDSLRLDAAETAHRAAAFYRNLGDRVAAEAALLRTHDARFVLADAPPVACAAAALAGIPSVVCANFTWDWIYDDYEEVHAAAPWLVASLQEAYAKAVAAWRLPMHGGFASFHTIVDVPFVARHARHDSRSVRRTLGLPLEQPLVLVSFGGYGVAGLDPGSIDALERYGLVVMGRPPSDRISGLQFVSEDALYGNGLRYEDLVHAVDVVVTKPGYGIIAECIANETAVLYTARGRFAEYDVLIREMPRYLRCASIDQSHLFAGRWREALDALLAQPAPPERPATDGASHVASLIRAKL